MGELVIINQPRRRSPLPATLGILGSSKGNTFAVGSGSGQPAPSVAPVDPGQVAAVLRTLDSIANPTPTRITATGEALPSSTDKARALAPPPAPVVASGSGAYPPSGSGAYPPSGSGAPPPPPPPSGSGAYPPSTGAPSRAPGGGGGSGGAGFFAPEEEQPDAGDPPVFLGLTQTQLLIGAGLAVGAFLLLRKKRPAAAAGGG